MVTGVASSAQLGFIDKPMVLGKICENYIADILLKRDGLVYIADAEQYLSYMAKRSLTPGDVGILRSMALRYGVTSNADNKPLSQLDGRELLVLLRPVMLINMGRIAPNMAATINNALHTIRTPCRRPARGPEIKMRC